MFFLNLPFRVSCIAECESVVRDANFYQIHDVESKTEDVELKNLSNSFLYLIDTC